MPQLRGAFRNLATDVTITREAPQIQLAPRRLNLRLKVQDACQTRKKRPKALISLLNRDGALEEIRTPDPQIRSLMLYPAELRVLEAMRPTGNPFRRQGRTISRTLPQRQVEYAPKKHFF